MFTESIPKEQLIDWLGNTTTKAVFKILTEVRQQHKDELLNGNSLDLTSSEATALRTTLLLGRIAGLNMILEMEIGE